MWPFSKKLEDVVLKSKTIKVSGVKITIKKLDPSSYIDGSQTMLQEYDTYKLGPKPSNNEDLKKQIEKTKEHYRDVFMASVVEPKLKRKSADPEGLLVDHLFTDWEFATELYQEILYLTYGKKKLRLALLRAKRSLK